MLAIHFITDEEHSTVLPTSFFFRYSHVCILQFATSRASMTYSCRFSLDSFDGWKILSDN